MVILKPLNGVWRPIMLIALKPFTPSHAKWRGSTMYNATSFTNEGELNLMSLENNLIILRRKRLSQILLTNF